MAVAKVHEANRGYKPYKMGGSPLIKSEPLLKTPSGGTAVPIVRRTLTVEERKERTAKGLCFNCDEQYKPSHKCQGKLFRLCAENNCLVEVVEPVAEEAEIEVVGGEIEISMHALSESFNPMTIRLSILIVAAHTTLCNDQRPISWGFPYGRCRSSRCS